MRRSIALFFFLLTIIGLVAACCDQKSFTSCCGKGKCNIFCCNCKGGCKPYTDCCNDSCFGLCIPVGEGKAMCMENCKKHCSNRALELDKANPFKADPEWSAKSDEEMFDAVSGIRDHFTYEEFLQHKGWKDEVGARLFFDRFDRNNDSRITLDEMRESEDEDDVRQHDPLTKKPIPTPIVSRDPKDEL